MREYRPKHPREIVDNVLDLISQGKAIADAAKFVGVPRSTVVDWCGALKEKRTFVYPEDLPEVRERVESDRKREAAVKAKRQVSQKNRFLIEEIERLEQEKEALLRLRESPNTLKITPASKTKGEATAFMVASDWHSEERVDPETVNHLNSFDLDEADRRIKRFFQNGLTLLKMNQREISIPNLVLPLLGDFITGNIHEELLETCLLPPIEAIVWVQRRVISGIDFLLEHTDCDIVIPCHSGNHSRITKRLRHSTEAGNALEYFMYHNLIVYYDSEDRIKILPTKSYHNYLKVYDRMVRTHHGHGLRYLGGVGGIYIPVNKAIAQWNKARHADFDIFGHYHQFKDGGNFICNGSLIGYNPFAISIKADYEQPRQAFFLIDKDRGKTIVAPILVTRN